MITCKACGAKVSDEYGYCTNCLAPLDVAVVSSNIPPACRVCGKDMRCIDTESQKWYCYNDDEVFWAKENRWDEHKLQPHFTPPPYSNTRKFAIKLLKRVIIIIILVYVGILLLFPSFWQTYLAPFIAQFVAVIVWLLIILIVIWANCRIKKFSNKMEEPAEW